MSHAIERAQERYGLTLEWADIEAMRVLILEGAAELIEQRPEKNSEKWLVWCSRMTRHFPVVFIPEAGRIVTILDWDAAEIRRYRVKKLRVAK